MEMRPARYGCQTRAVRGSKSKMISLGPRRNEEGAHSHSHSRSSGRKLRNLHIRTTIHQSPFTLLARRVRRVRPPRPSPPPFPSSFSTPGETANQSLPSSSSWSTSSLSCGQSPSPLHDRVIDF